MKLVFRPYAEREIREAADWYEERQAGLRETFVEAIDVHVLGVVHDARHPSVWRWRR